MSEWNVIHENFHTKHSVFTAPDAHTHTSFSYTLWAYNQQLKTDKEGVTKRDKETQTDRQRQNHTKWMKECESIMDTNNNGEKRTHTHINTHIQNKKIGHTRAGARANTPLYMHIHTHTLEQIYITIRLHQTCYSPMLRLGVVTWLVVLFSTLNVVKCGQLVGCIVLKL